MSEIIAVSTLEECVEQLVKAVARQDVLASVYYSRELLKQGGVKRLDDPGSATQCSALATAAAHSPARLPLLILSLLLQLGASPTAGSPSAWDVVSYTNNSPARRLLEGNGTASWEAQAAKSLIKMDDVEAEQWISHNLQDSPAAPPINQSPHASAEVPLTPIAPPSPSVQRSQASPPPQALSFPAIQPLSTILAANVAPSVQPNDLAELFDRLPGFSSVMVLDNPGAEGTKLAFVRFASVEEADLAMRARQGAFVQELPLDLSLVSTPPSDVSSDPSASMYCPPSSRSSSSALAFSPPPETAVPASNYPALANPASSVSIAVRNIPPHLNNLAIATLLSSPIKGGFQPFRINYSTTPPCSFIDLNDANDVPLAISALHGLDLCGHILVVEQRQLFKEHPYRLLLPDLPAGILFAAELEAYLALMGAEGIYGVTVHESLRGVDERDYRNRGEAAAPPPAMHAYCNFHLQAEMEYATQQLSERGIAVERDRWNSKVAVRLRADAKKFYDSAPQPVARGRGRGGRAQTSRTPPSLSLPNLSSSNQRQHFPPPPPPSPPSHPSPLRMNSPPLLVTYHPSSKSRITPQVTG